jgi:hypothetical protein
VAAEATKSFPAGPSPVGVETLGSVTPEDADTGIAETVIEVFTILLEWHEAESVEDH